MEQAKEVEAGLARFKTAMLLTCPFYGDILLKIPILRDDSVPTACTDGRTIRWGLPFFKTLSVSQRNYVLMHEVFHALLMHPSRKMEREDEIWNVAADLVVNQMCDDLMNSLYRENIPELSMRRPERGWFMPVPPMITTENLYGMILKDQDGARQKNRLQLRGSYMPGAQAQMRVAVQTKVGGEPWEKDLVHVKLSEEEARLAEDNMRRILREAAARSQGRGGSFRIPRQLDFLLRKKTLPWKKLLRDFLTETQSEETSYATPERKYLHMEMILPGHGKDDGGELESVWAFVDSSGSISDQEMKAFLGELYHLVHDFNCEMNIAYWDTSVTDVYRRIRGEKALKRAMPQHSGGTDINCVYRWVRDQKIRPLVAVILTDGYFGTLEKGLSMALPKNKTFLILSNQDQNPLFARMGRVARLRDTD